MKDEPRKPLEALGDEVLEARVVAWVLGEASAFEVEELEQACKEDPALQAFAERMQEVHGLIEEDRKTGPEDEWKLPEEKRRKVVDLLGVEPPAKTKVRRMPMRMAALAVLFSTMSSFVSFGAVFSNMLNVRVGELDQFFLTALQNTEAWTLLLIGAVVFVGLSYRPVFMLPVRMFRPV